MTTDDVIKTIAQGAAREVLLLADELPQDIPGEMRLRVGELLDDYVEEHPDAEISKAYAGGSAPELIERAVLLALGQVDKWEGASAPKPTPKSVVGGPVKVEAGYKIDALTARIVEMVESMPLIQRRGWLVSMLMEKRGITAADVARKHGFSRWHIAGAVGGRHGWSRRVVMALEAELGVELSQFRTPNEISRGE